MSRRTAYDFTVKEEIWPVVENWAKETGFRLKESRQSRKLYQKGHGILVAPMMLEITKTEEKVYLEAWVMLNFFIRLSVLFMVPSEMGIESGGFRLVAPRKIARNAVNKLLSKLGQPVIP